MKWGQNLLSLKYQRSLPVGFGGSKTAGRDRIVADTWRSLTVLFGSKEEGNRLSTGRVQPRGRHTALTGRQGQGRDTAQQCPAHGLAGGTQSLTWARGQTGTATPQAAICWAHAGKTYTNKRVILALAAPIPMSCFAGQDIYKSLMGSQL